jgi:Helitron helicase-like domain at N-terminus
VRLFLEEISGNRLTRCCANGKYIAPALPEVPAEMLALYRDRKWPRLSKTVNDSSCFTSVAVSRPLAHGGKGGLHMPHHPPCVMRLEGSIVHFPQNLAGQPRTQNDTAKAVAQAAHGWFLTGPRVPESLQSDVSHFAQRLRTVLLKYHPATSHSPLRSLEEELEIEFEKVPDTDEVVALYQTPDNVHPPQLEYIYSRDPNSFPLPAGLIDMLAFPTFFPYQQAPFSYSGSLSRLKWIRSLIFKQILRFTLSTTLFQAYILTTWNEIEVNRINSYRTQRKKRIGVPGDAPDAQDHQSCNLPASFPGGPAYYAEHVGAALFAASKLGFTNVLFTTMTQDPKCSAAADVASESERPLPSEADNGHMDVLVRGFLCARENLHTSLKSGNCLPLHLRCHTKWYLESVEFQGRGLPHVHRLDCFSGADWSVSDIDGMLWGHWPSQEEENFFYEVYGVSLQALVRKHMMHSHTAYCGGSDDNCRFNYPFAQRDSTTIDENNRVQVWRGPGDGYIVPYNPSLLCAAQCHIHTNIISGVNAIPYVCKYLGKGDTTARTAIVEARAKRSALNDPNASPVDVSTVYMKRRMVSYSEALVRLMEGDLVRRWPPVATVHVILPRADTMKQSAQLLRPGEEKPYYTDVERWLLRPDAFKDYTIAQYFGLTLSKGVDAATPVPRSATAHMDKCQANPRLVWKKVRLQHLLCRIAPVHKSNTETFWLRMLLMQQDMKATSVQEICSFQNSEGVLQQFQSFSAAADARGLQLNAKAAELVLAECIVDTLGSPEMCRSCLTILVRNFDCSGNLLRLVSTYWEHLAESDWPETARAKLAINSDALRACYARILQV